MIKTLLTSLKENNIKFSKFFAFYIFASLIVSASTIIGQILVGEMGQAAYKQNVSTLIRFLLVLTAVLCIKAIFSALSALFVGRFAGISEYNFRYNFIKFFLHQPFKEFDKTNSGERISVFTNDLPQAVKLVSTGVLGMLSDFLLLIVLLVYMFYINWFHTLIFVATFPILALIQILISKPIQKTVDTALEAQGKFNAIVNDSLQNTATVIAYALEDKLEDRYVSAYMKYHLAFMDYIRTFSILVVVGFVASALPLVYLFIASGFSVLNESKLISEFIIFTGIGILAAGWLMDLAQSLGGVGVWVAGAKRLNETISGDIEHIEHIQHVDISGDVAVAFDNVSFAYTADSENILSNVSFEIPRNAKVAIIGSSGSGKSTVLKLLLGLYDANDGKISVFGADTENISKYDLRDTFAYVPQGSFLFPLSISENIMGKAKLLPQEQIRLEKACSDAGILDFIDSLPDKFDSILSESAENISGGQRQRIAMARAFYKDAPIILFDEATSALDPTTELEILKTLEESTQDKTVIMVAHRSAAKAFCDTIITLDGGTVI